MKISVPAVATAGVALVSFPELLQYLLAVGIAVLLSLFIICANIYKNNDRHLTRLSRLNRRLRAAGAPEFTVDANGIVSCAAKPECARPLDRQALAFIEHVVERAEMKDEDRIKERIARDNELRELKEI